MLLFRFVQGHPWICIYLNQVSHSYDDMVQDKEDYSGTNSEIIIPNLKYFQLQVQKIISVPKNLKNNFVVFFHIFNEVYSCFSIWCTFFEEKCLSPVFFVLWRPFKTILSCLECFEFHDFYEFYGSQNQFSAVTSLSRLIFMFLLVILLESANLYKNPFFRRDQRSFSQVIRAKSA